MRVQQEQCESCGRFRGDKHLAVTPPPEIETIQGWIMDMDNAEATDGCEVEPDGICEHGHQSWLLIMAII